MHGHDNSDGEKSGQDFLKENGWCLVSDEWASECCSGGTGRLKEGKGDEDRGS